MRKRFIRLAKSEGACSEGVDRLRYWASTHNLDLRKTEISEYFQHCLRHSNDYSNLSDMRWCFRHLIAWSKRESTARHQAFRILGIAEPEFNCHRIYGVCGALYDIGYVKSYRPCVQALIRAFSD